MRASTSTAPISCLPNPPILLAISANERTNRSGINTPPVIHLQEISTRPASHCPCSKGKVCQHLRSRRSANESFHCEWEMGDDSGPKTYDDALKHVYTAPGDYTSGSPSPTMTAASRSETTVHVRNTSRGSLYIDETWRGTHHLTGK